MEDSKRDTSCDFVTVGELKEHLTGGLVRLAIDQAAQATSVESVLREHIAFLREQLEAKQHWYEQALEEQKAETKSWRDCNKANHDAWIAIQKERERLRVALASAVEHIRYEHEDEVNSDWEALLEVK